MGMSAHSIEMQANRNFQDAMSGVSHVSAWQAPEGWLQENGIGRNLPPDTFSDLPHHMSFDASRLNASRNMARPERVSMAGTAFLNESPNNSRQQSSDLFSLLPLGIDIAALGVSSLTRGFGSLTGWEKLRIASKNVQRGSAIAFPLVAIACGPNGVETAPAPFALSAESAIARIQEYGAELPNGSLTNASCDAPAGTVKNISFSSKQTNQNLDAIVCAVDVNATGVASINGAPALVLSTGEVFLAGNLSIDVNGEHARGPLYEVTKDGKIVMGSGNSFEVQINKNREVTGFDWMNIHNAQYDIQNTTVATAIPMLQAFSVPGLMSLDAVINTAMTVPGTVVAPAATPTEAPTAIPTPKEIKPGQIDPDNPKAGPRPEGDSLEIKNDKWARPSKDNEKITVFWENITNPKTGELILQGWYYDAGGGSMMDAPNSGVPKASNFNIKCEEGLPCPSLSHQPNTESYTTNLSMSSYLYTQLHERHKKLPGSNIPNEGIVFDTALKDGTLALPFTRSNGEQYVYKVSSADTMATVYVTNWDNIKSPDVDWKFWRWTTIGDDAGNLNMIVASEPEKKPLAGIAPRDFMQLVTNAYFNVVLADQQGTTTLQTLGAGGTLAQLVDLTIEGDHPYWIVTYPQPSPTSSATATPTQ